MIDDHERTMNITKFQDDEVQKFRMMKNLELSCAMIPKQAYYFNLAISSTTPILLLFIVVCSFIAAGSPTDLTSARLHPAI